MSVVFRIGEEEPVFHLGEYPVRLITLLAALFLLSAALSAQVSYDTSLTGKMRWREIGPARGGRSDCRRSSRQWRQHVRDAEMPQHRHHDGFHRA